MKETKGFDPIKRAEILRPRMIDLKNKKRRNNRRFSL